MRLDFKALTPEVETSEARTLKLSTLKLKECGFASKLSPLILKQVRLGVKALITVVGMS